MSCVLSHTGTSNMTKSPRAVTSCVLSHTGTSNMTKSPRAVTSCVLSHTGTSNMTKSLTLSLADCVSFISLISFSCLDRS